MSSSWHLASMMMVGRLDVVAAGLSSQRSRGKLDFGSFMLLLHAQLRLGLRSTPPSDQLNGCMIPKMIPGPGKGGSVPLEYGHFWYLPVSFKGGVCPDFMMSVDFGENFHPWASEGGRPRGVGP